ncbi:MAG TPA: hypothetical protein ENK33_03995 [Desulfobacterales bacterium]|nr:hypothetical protein [Desulfobacterales bacterium]
MTKSSHNILEDKLRRAMGIDLQTVGHNSLRNAIARRMRVLGIKERRQYYELTDRSAAELNELIDEVAVNETWFFRDNTPFLVLQRYARNWLKRGRGSCLRILSVPCASGEEPYSIAIALLEAGVNGLLFKIDAIDISYRALRLARRGIYGRNSFRGRNNFFQRKYFQKTKAGYVIAKHIRHPVNFVRANILDTNLPILNNRYDIIFCRNLLIYLDKDNQKLVVSILDKLLVPEGLIFTGHAEPGAFADSVFIPAPYPKAFALTRRSATDCKPDQLSCDRQVFPPPLPVQPLWFTELDAVRDLADTGQHEEAMECCEQYIRRHGPDKEAYFLMGMILADMDEPRLAIRMLKKAVYLDPDLVKAIDMLALLYKGLGDDNNYRVFKQRAQRVTARNQSAGKGK